MPKKYNYTTKHLVCRKIDNRDVVLFECSTEEGAKKEIAKWKDKGYFYKAKKEKVKRIDPNDF
ncbi:hypothetical protein GW764_01525 [Candidatus Parcubacteria bacterium]|nr:hypothetical protein [Candidatus Parcubacteria bacterium]